MKRRVFQITGSNGQQATAYAWNAAVRKIEALVREAAGPERCTYHLADSESIKDESCGGHVSGLRTWKNDAGNAITYTINRL